MSLKKEYISEIDEFIQDFDATHAKSASQQAEIRKYQNIGLLRDDANAQPDPSEIWQEF